MPTKKQQYNMILDDVTDDLLWEIVAEEKTTATKALRALIATHPRIVAKAKARGVTPQPELAGWGGKRTIEKR